MKPKGLQDRTLDPYHGLKLLGAWAGTILVAYGVFTFVGFLLILLVQAVGLRNVAGGAVLVGMGWWVWRELRRTWDSPSWRDWT